MYRKPCIDVTQFCNDLCIGHNVALLRDTFVALWCVMVVRFSFTDKETEENTVLSSIVEINL